MTNKTPLINHYEFGDLTISISSNSSQWLTSLDAYLSLQAIAPGDIKPHIKLIIDKVTPDRLDQELPLPDKQYLKHETKMLVDRAVPYNTYSKGKTGWRDFKGFGRTVFEHQENAARSLWLENSGISTVYADIIFGYNPLLGMLSRHGYTTVHASCAQIQGKGILFTGKSGSGKSTAAYALLGRKHPVLADDRILLKNEEGYLAHSISDVVKIDENTLVNFFPDLKVHEPLHKVGEERYLKIGKHDDLRYIHKTNLDYLMVFERTGTAQSRLEKIKPAEVIGHLFPVTMAGFNPDLSKAKFSFLMDMLERLPCYRVHFGTDMDHFVNTLEELAQKES